MSQTDRKPTVTTPQSLTDFAQASNAPLGPRVCAICRLETEILDELNAGARAGIPQSVVLSWLQTQVGITTLTRNNVDYHYRNKHYQESQ